MLKINVYGGININFPRSFSPQHQDHNPGFEYEMNPLCIFNDFANNTKGDLLKDKVAIITGGDSGIGRAIAVAYAKQGAELVIVHYNEKQDTEEIEKIIESLGRKYTIKEGDISDVNFCKDIVETTMKENKKIDILINNAAIQYECKDIKQLSD
jgi:NADP-dependent 3-hydroxy acid dehydrogenase YdfG